MTRGPAALAALVAGGVHTLGFAPTGWWPLQLLALTALAWLTHAGGARRAALLGGSFGLGWFASGVSWVYVSMHHYGGMPAVLAATATLAFAAYLALFPAAALAVARMLRPAPGAPRALAFAAAWTLSELARGWLFTGFPWLAAGYAHTDGPLAGLAPLSGVYGVTAAAALVAALAAEALAAPAWRRLRPIVAAAVVLAVGAALTQVDWTQPSGAPLRVRLLQGNVPQQMKFDPQVVRAAMRRYVELIEAAPAPLTVLPEIAWTQPWRATPADLAARIDAYLRRHAAAVAIGMPLFVQTGSLDRITNSVGVLHPAGVRDADGLAGRYDKRHLVPFGEFVPWGFRWFVDLMHIPLGDFGRGDARQPPIAIGGQRVAFNVCYEDLFGEELAGAVADGATVLVNVSNIAWFGDSLALPQHLQISRMRAIETGRPMLRATNTGVTASIDARGRVQARLPALTEGVLEIDAIGHAGLTPFVRAGNLPAAVLAIGTLFALGFSRARHGHGPDRGPGAVGVNASTPAGGAMQD